jgi:hypothetical protein
MLTSGLTAFVAACFMLLVGTGGRDSSKVGSVSLLEVRSAVECSDGTGPPMGIPGWKSKVCLGKQVIVSLADIQRDMLSSTQSTRL